MPARPYREMSVPDHPGVICLLSSSIDGGLHPSRFAASPDGTTKDWSGLYEALHDQLNGDAWLVGRTTMAEMVKGEPHSPRDERPEGRQASGCGDDGEERSGADGTL
jgi:hypothetical protein